MRLWNRIRYLLSRSKHEAELAEEMRLHREAIVEQLVREGVPPAEAAQEANRVFGNRTSILEQSADQWSFAWLEALFQDVKFALRTLRRNRAFTATAVLTLGAGLGLNTVLFTVFNAYALRPIEARDPESLYQLYWRAKGGFGGRFTWQEFLDLQKQKTLSDVTALDLHVLTSGGQTLICAMVAGNFFEILGSPLPLGRPILRDDAAKPGDRPVAVISHSFWKSVYGEDPTVIGKRLKILGLDYDIIGVTSPSFRGLSDIPPDVWIPVTMSRWVRPGADLFGPDQPARLQLFGRAEDEAAVVRASTELTPFVRGAASRQLAGEAKELQAYLKSKARVVPDSPELLAALSPVFGAFLLVLITCCANVSNMMLARAAARQREIGVRLSLGAGRARLIRQLLTEAFLIALLAAAVGLAVADGLVDFTLWLLMSTVPSEFGAYIRVVPLTVDYRVFLFITGAALAATVIFGLAPSLQATRTNLVSALRGEFSSRFRSSRLRDALVVSQVTTCTVLLACAALLFHNAARLGETDPGLKTGNVLHVQMDRPEVVSAVAAKLHAMDGVEAISVSERVPFFGRMNRIAITPEGAQQVSIAAYAITSPGYLPLLGVPVLRGRLFTEDEGSAQAAVAIINQSAARRFWPGADPLGKKIRLESNDRYGKLPGYSSVEIVGVAPDVTQGWIFEGKEAVSLYFPTNVGSSKAEEILVRAKPGSRALASQIAAMVNTNWPAVGSAVRPLDQALAIQVYPFRAASWIAELLSVLSLILTVSGIYGVMSFMVNQRTKEIGIRLALGATPQLILSFVMRHSMKLACLGMAMGAGFSVSVQALLVRYIEFARVFDWSPLVVIVSVGVTSSAALIAALSPALRAMRIDPSSTLRAD